MGVYYKDYSKYTIKYNDSQFDDLYLILNKTIHYVYTGNHKWKYIEDDEKLIEFFKDEEFGDSAEGKGVFVDKTNSLLSIDGEFIREHGKGTHLEINEEYLFEKLFDYDNNILIIKDSEFVTDYDINDCSNKRELFYKCNGTIGSIYLDSEEDINDFDKLIESSDLKLFFSESFEDINIDEEIKNIYPRNIKKFFDKYKDKLSEENIIDLVKLDIHLLEELDDKLINIVKNDKTILNEVAKNCDFYTIKCLEEDLIDSIVNDKDILISFLNNNDGYWEIYQVSNIDEISDDDFFEYKVLKEYENDKDIMLLLIKNFDYPYFNLNYELTEDRDILIEAFKRDERSLEYADEDLRDDEELLKQLMKINKEAYKYASERLCEKYKSKNKNTDINKKIQRVIAEKRKAADEQLSSPCDKKMKRIFKNIINGNGETADGQISLFDSED